MRSVQITRYGSSDVLRLVDVPKPVPADSELLIRIHVASVTPSDCAFRKGDPFIIKLMYGLRKPRNNRHGVEFAGVVETAGKAVTRYRPGDRVFAISANDFGAHAEFIAVPENGLVVALPDAVSFEHAVGLLDGGLTSLTFLRDIANVQPGQRVLVNGASGAVGISGVQLAKHFGAHVTGVCSARNFDMVMGYGADTVIDYTEEDFTQRGDTWDVIYDTVGKRTYHECRRALNPAGVYLTTVPTLAIVVAMLGSSLFGRKKARFAATGLQQKRENLVCLLDLYAQGVLKVHIDRRYALDKIADAHRYVDTGHKRGNVLITAEGRY